MLLQYILILEYYFITGLCKQPDIIALIIYFLLILSVYITIALYTIAVLLNLYTYMYVHVAFNSNELYC